MSHYGQHRPDPQSPPQQEAQHPPPTNAAAPVVAETATKPSAATKPAKNSESDSSEGASGFAPNKDRSGTDATASQTQSSGSRNQSTGDSAQGSSTSADSNDDAPERNKSTDAAKKTPTPTTTNTNTTTNLQQESLDTPEQGSNLFVAGLPSTVDDAVLAAAFSAHGRVVSAKVMLHVETAVSRGFGFVLFPTAAEAEHAREMMQGVAIDGHGGRLQITVSKHRGENVTAESRVVYVRHVPSALVGSADLSGFLAKFGTVAKVVTRSAEQQQQHSDERLCNIIVTFGSVEAARECVAACHGKTPLAQCKIPLLSKMEEPQTLREQRLREQRMAQNQRAAEVPVADASMLVATVKLPHLPAPQGGSAHRAGARTPSGSSVASTNGSAPHNNNTNNNNNSRTTSHYATQSQHHHHAPQHPHAPGHHGHYDRTSQRGSDNGSNANPNTNPNPNNNNNNTNMSAPNTALAPPLMPPFGFPGMYGMMPPMPPHAYPQPPPFGPYSMPQAQQPPTPGQDTRTSHQQHTPMPYGAPGAPGLMPFPGAMAFGQGMPPYMPPPFHTPYQPPR